MPVVGQWRENFKRENVQDNSEQRANPEVQTFTKAQGQCEIIQRAYSDCKLHG